MGEKMKEKSSGTHCKGTAIPAGKIPFSWALGQVFSNIQLLELWAGKAGIAQVAPS